ncbi:N-acetylmuramoyl-L-alanine amidase family protein [Sulfidibacter corallicola]|uniref:N-acetylmuramoyl-L-alanine amidase n=1 Tax=Sulfidibacter corallicola TaxID=2818388 RepID=A0A8A4TXZ4_SULCO|nr:N-acetylmuramoyl-L-alanine amidase [Sulfidibacter corallicola]QTD54370.1 N-acetylmuramoyl-L-alanine amidase [Sulfidibacter corallicola]
MSTIRHYLISISAFLLFGHLSSLPCLAWQNQVLRKLDHQSFAALNKPQGAHLDVRVAKPEELIPSVKIYTGRFGDENFSLRKYNVVRINSKRALIPYFELSPTFRKTFLSKLWPDDKLVGDIWHHRVKYAGHETLWSVSQWLTGTGTHWKTIKKASGMRSNGVYKGLRLKIPRKVLFPILRGDPIASLPRPEDPRPARETPPAQTTTADSDEPSVQSGATEPVSPVAPADDVTPAAESAGPVFHDPTPIVQDPEPLAEEPGPTPDAEAAPTTEDPAGNETVRALEQDSPTAEEQLLAGEEGDDIPEPIRPEEAGAPPAADSEQPWERPAIDAETKRGRQILRQLARLDEQRALLRWGEDRKGRYAEYRLRAGEAIYSSVVVRFCGLTRAADVRRLARVVIDRNDIRDETDLAIGTPIRIPYENLEPEFRREDDKDFQAFIDNLSEVSLMTTEVRSRNLEGVHVILDAGHGGRDPGAAISNVWEDDFVYDIVCRIKKRLEEESGAVVMTTVLDPSVDYKVQDVRRFRRDQDEMLLTSPRYPLSAKNMRVDGVHLRWLLANNRYQQLLDRGVKSENVVFASIHAESLHRSIRGSMYYIPDARLYPKKTPAHRYARFAEYEGNKFRFNRKMMRRAQALSTSFALNLKEASEKAGIRVYHQKPIRSAIYRNPRRPFVPAVIRYNRIPTRVLVEVCNLNNRHDRELMTRPEFRQKMADAFVESVYATYSARDTRLPAVHADTAPGR